MKIALLDMDGVIVDFVAGAMRAHGISKTQEQLWEGSLGQWDMAPLFRVSWDEFFRPMSEDWWANLDWTPDGEAILKMVEERFDQVVIVTSPIMTTGCHEGKLRWMRRHLPKKYSRGSGHIFATPKHLMSNPSHVLIDDRDENVDRFRAYGGGVAVEVPRISNRQHPRRHWTLDEVGIQLEELCASR
jgi:5'(3')-deoxyribonucleotidase